MLSESRGKLPAVSALSATKVTLPCHDSVLVLEPGQGHVAVGVMDLLKPMELSLFSRDMLALTFATRNVRNNFSIKPGSILAPYLKSVPEQELIVWKIRRKNDLMLNTHNLRVLLEGDQPLLIYGKRTLLCELLKRKYPIILKNTINRNYSAQMIRSK